MATQQSPYRRPMFYDLPQIRRAAARTPVTYERDLEAEMRLKQSLVESISELEKTKAEIRKATMDEFTQQRVEVMKGWADLYQAAASAASASASAKNAYADFANSLNKALNDERGKIAAGTPDAKFAEAYKKDVLDQEYNNLYTTFGNTAAEQNELFNQLKSEFATGGASSPAFEKMAQFMEANLGQLKMDTAGQINSQVGTSSFAPNVGYMLEAGGSTIASAVENGLKDAPPELKKALTERLYTSFYSGVKAAVDRRDPNTFVQFAQSQQQARADIDKLNADAKKFFSVGVPAEIRNNATKAMQAISDEMISGNRVFAMQIAQERLAKAGMAPPAADAAPAEQEAYKKALAGELGNITSPETFARQMAKMEVSPEIDKQIEFLKGELDKVGQVPEDPLTKATNALRSAMGQPTFDAWQQFTGAKTAEEAALAATKMPNQFAAFKQVVANEPMALERPREFRKLVNTQAEAAAAKTTAEAKQAAKDYVSLGTTPPDQIIVEGGGEEPQSKDSAGQIEAEQPGAAPPVKKPVTEEDVQFGGTPADIQFEQQAQQAQPTPEASAASITAGLTAAQQQALASSMGARAQLFGTTPSPSQLLGGMARKAQRMG